MLLQQWLSLLSAVALAAAFWISSRDFGRENIIFGLQVAAYLLLAASSWLVGVRAAAFVLAMCAVTLTLKAIRKFPATVMFIFLLATLAGGLIVNNSGWLGVLPILAASGVVYRHAYRRTMPSISEILGIGSKEERKKGRVILLPKMDNAYRMPANAIDLFLHNIVGVVLWGAYAWQTGDRFMAAWRGIMLVINAFDYGRRIWPPISSVLASALPASDDHKRRRYPGKRNRGKWVV